MIINIILFYTKEVDGYEFHITRSTETTAKELR